MNTQNAVPDSEWVETIPVGQFTVKATFEVRNGIEIPWATKVAIEGPDIDIKLKGMNLLPRALMITDLLAANPIDD